MQNEAIVPNSVHNTDTQDNIKVARKERDSTLAAYFAGKTTRTIITRRRTGKAATTAPALPPMEWAYAEDHLTHTEGAIVEALRNLRRVETEPQARAEYLAWEEIRGMTAFDEEDRRNCCEEGDHKELLFAAATACEAYIKAYSEKWLKEGTAHRTK